jgi:hypothetical protein
MMGGVRIIRDPSMIDFVEDWSDVRSPARAKRRWKRGFRQRIKLIPVPKKHAYAMDGGRTLVMHPDVAEELERHIVRQLK